MNFKTAVVVCFVLLLAGGAHATSPIFPGGYLVQETAAYYQVALDGEGEATVVLKLDIYNLDPAQLAELTIELPGRPAELRYAFQELKQNRNQPNYLRVPFTRERFSEGSQYKLEIPTPILPRSGGTLLLYYKADGYVETGIINNFDFETMMFPIDLEKTRVSISVDEDLYLRGGETRVDYQSNFVSAASSFSGERGVATESSALNTISRNVPQDTGFVKTKRNLDPWESFHVEGSYAQNKYCAALYWGELILAAAIAFAFAVFTRRSRKWHWPKFPRSIASNGVVVAALWIVETEGLVKLGEWIGHTVRYGFAEMVFALLFLATAVIVYGFTIWTPLKPLWHKRDWRGIGLFVSTLVISLLVLGLITMVLFHTQSAFRVF